MRESTHMASAIQNIIWKLNRKTKDGDSPCEWATIDINDLVIREAQVALDAWREVQAR